MRTEPEGLVRLVGLTLVVLGVFGGLRPEPVAALEVGKKAPNFTLPSTTGEKVSLSQFQGKKAVLIEFYGADFAPVWMDHLTARKADYEKFTALGIQILGISADNPFSQKALADSLKLPNPLLSDLGLKTTHAYSVVYGKTTSKNDYPELAGLVSSVPSSSSTGRGSSGPLDR
jgi:peroxiredoxin